MKLLIAWVAVAPLLACGASDASLSDGGGNSPTAPATCQPDAGVVAQATGNHGTQIYVCAEASPVRGLNDFTYLVTDGIGRPEESLGLSVQLWMPNMGHGSPTTPTVTSVGNGLYQVTNCDLFMPGAWQLRTTISGPVADSVVPQFNIY